jgi:tetrahydromethanopterin S-methyltransferase subunit G
MRLFLPRPCLVALPAICLLWLGSAPVVRADGPSSPFEQLVASWMGVVGVIGAGAEGGAADGFEIDEKDADEAAAEDKREDAERKGDERRHRDHRGRGHHRPGGQGDRRHGPPPPGMMGPMGPGPHHGDADMHHHAMRAFHEIIRRLARIEEKLGIEDAPPSGPRGDRRPRPEMRGPRGPEGGAERPRRQLDIPEDVRRQMAERMESGRRKMAEARERMENARRRLQEMEERIEQLEAEMARLKGAK